MKKAILFLMLIIGAISAQAREPYGDYICRYIIDGGNYHSIYNPIKIYYCPLNHKKSSPTS